MTSGTIACVVHYNQAGNGNYNAAPQVRNTTAATAPAVSGIGFESDEAVL
jgi:hypothetical protein